MKIDIHVLVENYGGCTENVHLFLNIKDVLEFLNGELNEEFVSIQDFVDWQDNNCDTDKVFYTWYQKNLYLDLSLM